MQRLHRHDFTISILCCISLFSIPSHCLRIHPCQGISRSLVLKRFIPMLSTNVAPLSFVSGNQRNTNREQSSALRTLASQDSSSNYNSFSTLPQVAYRDMNVQIQGMDIPIAVWYSSLATNVAAPPSRPTLTYRYTISVRRIGQLLAGWEFIPNFVSRDFFLFPTHTNTVNGETIPFPSSGPVILLAHGFLGSRFDLCHLAEALAMEGFICISAEYPESLAASYESDNLDRKQINDQLLMSLTEKWGIHPTLQGIVGHSLGTGTVFETGNSDWVRVCIAGFPRQRNGSKAQGNVLFILSTNDCTFSWNGGKTLLPNDFVIMDPSILSTKAQQRFPSRAIVLFDGPGSPNHISFLAGGVNQAMIEFLSPLLPLAQALQIPVLDFDKYKESQDSKETGQIMIPLVMAYLKQEMKIL